MTPRDTALMRAASKPGGGDFDDVGAVVTAMRHMLDGNIPPSEADARHLYVLATMAEAAWKRLDDAMQAGGK